MIVSTYGSSVFVLYEHLLTLDAEVKYFLSRNVTGAPVLFFANRYLNLVAQCWLVVVEIDVTSFSPEVGPFLSLNMLL